MNSHDPAQLIAPKIFVFAKERKKVRAAGIEGVLRDVHARAAEWEMQYTPSPLP